MNIESRTEIVKGYRTHVIRGDIILSDIQSFLGALHESGQFDPTLHALWDVRSARFTEVSTAEVRELAFSVRDRWAAQPRRKTAVVITGDFQFGLSRMFEQFVGPVAVGRLMVFRDLQLALDWIEGRTSLPPLPADR